MAQVLNEYMTWKFQNLQLKAVLTTRGKRDPAAFFLTARCALRIISMVADRDSCLLVFHVSQGGSFVREGDC